MPYEDSYESRWRHVTEILAARALALAFPPLCLACNRISPDLRVRLGLCRSCIRLLDPVLDAGPLGFPVLSLWWYRPPLIEVVHGLKFRRFSFLGSELGAAMAARFEPQIRSFDVITPIPLDWRRRMRRGYNQAGIIADELGRRLDIPVRNLLRRSRRTLPQARLNLAQRQQNMERAFQAKKERVYEAMNVILVDDVITTGATLEAAAGTLIGAEVRSVLAVTAARTPASISARNDSGSSTPKPRRGAF